MPQLIRAKHVTMAALTALAASSADGQVVKPTVTGTLGVAGFEHSSLALLVTGSVSFVSRVFAATFTPIELEVRTPDPTYSSHATWLGGTECRDGRGNVVGDYHCGPRILPAASTEGMAILPIDKSGGALAFGYGRRFAIPSTENYFTGAIIAGIPNMVFVMRARVGKTWGDGSIGLSFGFPSREDIRRAREPDRRGRPPAPPPRRR